jgi:hypothetical protein
MMVAFHGFVPLSEFGLGMIILSFIIWCGSFFSVKEKLAVKIKNVAFFSLFLGYILFSLSIFAWHYNIYYETAPFWWDFAQFESSAWISKFGMVLIIVSFIVWLYSTLKRGVENEN